MNKDFRAQIMALWHKIFGDSHDYISMLFDAYFEKAYIDGYMDKDGNLISCMMAIPYTIACSNFKLYLNNNSKNDYLNFLRSGYLCGLATDENYRKQGIMSEMIRKCNISLFRNNNVLSFLIPSNDNTRRYYKKFGYVDVLFNYEYRYKSNNSNYNVDDLRDKNIITLNYNYIIGLNYKIYRLKTDYVKILQVDLKSLINRSNNIYEYKEIKSSILKSEKLSVVFQEYYSSFEELRQLIPGAIIFHTYKDFITILTENLINDGEVLLLKDTENKPLGMIFCSKYIQDEVVVQLLISKSEEIDNILLETLKFILPASTQIRVRCIPRCDVRHENIIGVPSVTRTKPDTCSETKNCEVKIRPAENPSLKPYAMAKILNVAEVLKFVSVVYPASEFSILIKEDEFEENRGLFMVKEGKVLHIGLDSLCASLFDKEYFGKSSGQMHCKISAEDSEAAGYAPCHELTVAELASALWSNASPSSDVQRGQIPSLPLTVALMLD